MQFKKYFTIILAFISLVAVGCNSGSSSNGSGGDNNSNGDLKFEKAAFSNPAYIDHRFFPLTKGKTLIYTSQTEGGLETIIVEMLDQTRDVAGVTCAVVRDRVFLDEELIEDTHDWYAQDDAGNVWYMGEEVINYEYDDDGELIETNNDGAWETGLDVAEIGYIAEAGPQVKATPTIGDSFHQEYYEGEAEDMALVEATDVTVTLADGTVYTGCLKTKEWNPLEEDSVEYKYYAPGIGMIKETSEDGEEVVELKGIFATGAQNLPDFASATFTSPTLIDHRFFPQAVGTKRTYREETEDGTEVIVIEVLDETREVDGIECLVIRDRVFLDDVIVEDTYDWFAQDDAGNVWYMGEEVVNYEYDEDGNLLETNIEGSWEAGVDDAQGGIQMWADPAAGASYYQEYYEEDAEDMAMIVATGVTVTLEDGTSYEDCLQTLDWTPLEPTALEYKFYAPDVGFIKEIHLGSDDPLELEEIE
jgi:hypothetical protein